MSVFEPGAEPDHHTSSDPPQFRVAVRGYDRNEVAAYVQELWAHLENERQRAEQAERTIAQLQAEATTSKSQTPSFEHLGVEAAKVLEQAGQSAELLLEEAEGRRKAILDEARTKAADLVAEAERRAERLRTDATENARKALEEAHEAADRIRREAEEESTEAKARTDRMKDLHDSLIEHLTRVRQDLSALLGLSEEPAPAAPARAEGDPAAAAQPAAAEEPAPEATVEMGAAAAATMEAEPVEADAPDAQPEKAEAEGEANQAAAGPKASNSRDGKGGKEGRPAATRGR
jgi:cell division septum initiation protein DivIVA